MSDDYSADTQTTGTVTVGGSATGTIETSRDVDWFAVRFVAGRTYVIDMEGADGGGGTLDDTLLFGVFDDEGTRVAGKSGTGGEGGDARIVFTASETGTHYIAAKGFRKDDTGTYTVRVREYDADATAAGAADLGGLAGEWVVRRDSVDGGDDAADNWRFTLDETQVVTLRLRQQDADADLYLEDADGTVLHASTRDGTRGEDITAALQAGTYYVRVAAQEAGDNGYLFRARAEDPAPAVPEPPVQPAAQQPEPPAQPATQRQTIQRQSVDPDATRGGANDLGWLWSGRLVTYERFQKGTVDGGNDATDYYRFATKDRQKVTLKLDRQDADADLFLEDSEGNVLASSTKDGTRKEAVDETLEAGTYYVRVAAQETGQNSYRLKLINQQVDELDDFSADKSTTGRVTVGGSAATGEIDNPGDRDWFRVELKAGKHYRIDMKGSSTGDGTLYNAALTLYDSEGTLQQARSFPPHGHAFDTVGANGVQFYTPQETGTYYVSAWSNGPGELGTYKLSVQEVEEAPKEDDFGSDTTSAGTIAVGGTVQGNIQYVGDSDWFRVSLEADKTYEVSRSGRAEIYPAGTSPTEKGTLANSRIRGAIYDDEGALIEGTAFSRTHIGAHGTIHWPGRGLNKDWMRFTPDEDGTYYVSVTAEGWFAAQGTYTLSVDEVDAM